MKQQLFMLVWDMDVDKGGLNRVMLNRSAMLSDHYDVSLLTLDHKENYDEIKKKLSDAGRLHPDVNFLNVHDYYRKEFSSQGVTEEQLDYLKEQTKLYEEGFQIQDDEVEEKNCARYFINGQYIKYKKWHKSGVLSHIDYFNESRYRIYREEFSKNGSLYKKTFFAHNNEPNQELYYTEDGKCYLNKWYNPKNGSIFKIFLINPQTGKVKHFRKKKEFHTYWIEELALKSKSKPIMICDGPGSAHIPIDISSEYIYKLFMIHTNHFDYPHSYGSDLKEDHVYLLENIAKEDAVILLTDAQKRDIIKQFGDYDNVHVIPHTITPMSDNNELFSFKDDKLVSMLARYHPEKRIDHAIVAFKKVVEKFPDAKLEIYGEGEDRERLEEVISECNLKKNVFLKGYTTEVEKVYSKSLVSLLTSIFEGFSLVLLESMACKTPAIAYDVPYGPKDIINEDISVLVEDGNTDQLAEEIIWMLENPEKAIEMGVIAKKHVEDKYNYDDHKQKWLKLLRNFR